MTRRDWGRPKRQRRLVFVTVALSVRPYRSRSRRQQRRSRSPMSTRNRHLVSVKVAGPPRATADVLDVLRERIGSARARHRSRRCPRMTEPAPSSPGASDEEQLGASRSNLAAEKGSAGSTANGSTLYVVDGAWEHVLVRPVIRQANPEVTWEEIGHIVELALGALRAGESIGGIALSRARSPSCRRRLRWYFRRLRSRRRRCPPGVPLPRPTTGASPCAQALYSALDYGPALELTTGPGAVLELQAPLTLFGRRFEYGGTVMGEYHFPSYESIAAAQS